MPANIPPQYFEAKKQYRHATDHEENIAALQTMLPIMPKHKGTDKIHAETETQACKALCQGGKRIRYKKKRNSLLYTKRGNRSGCTGQDT